MTFGLYMHSDSFLSDTCCSQQHPFPFLSPILFFFSTKHLLAINQRCHVPYFSMISYIPVFIPSHLSVNK